MENPKDHAPCHGCGTMTPINELDAKPKRLAGQPTTAAMVAEAAENGEEFDILECQKCYGPGWVKAGT